MSEAHGPAAVARLDLPPVLAAADVDGASPSREARTVEDLVAQVRVDVEDQTSGQPEPPRELPGEPVVPPVALYGWNPGLPG